MLENTDEKKPYDFVDQNGDKWKEYIVLHPKFKEWYNAWKVKNTEKFSDYLETELPNIEELSEKQLKEIQTWSPYHNSTAYEIDPIQRVKLQAKIQKYIDHSISSTINLPENTTEKQVSDLYMTAWKEGCKGLTIYRDNCRTGVLVSTEQKDEEFKTHNAPKRPKNLPCDIHSIKIKGEEFQVLVGLYNNKPYEIFTIQNFKNVLTENQGYITKVSKGNYYITVGKESKGSFNITEQLTDEEESITRLVSTSLRHGADIQFIVEQLNKTHGNLINYGKSIARVLKKYIKNETETKEICPTCNSKLTYKDGCIMCLQCGHSKCN